jgi:lipopolysaccharide/colanic/teichoic acid biosynthesis glycosyltransferase
MDVLDDFFKRAFDISSSLIGLVCLSPIIFLSAGLIRLSSSGPVFYRGLRVGRYGKTFRIFKFRTMVADAESRGASSTSDDDPRITRIGKFLRKYKLDELPQLINVLRGEMSIVGPRPEVKKFTDLFSVEESTILTVRPGITDWASLWNPDEGALLQGSLDPDQDYLEKIRPEKVRLQLKYVRERSFWTDLRIIFQTLQVVVKR